MTRHSDHSSRSFLLSPEVIEELQATPARLGWFQTKVVEEAIKRFAKSTASDLKDRE